jgi:hypothetical protein
VLIVSLYPLTNYLEVQTNLRINQVCSKPETTKAKHMDHILELNYHI